MTTKGIVFTAPCIAELIDVNLPPVGDNDVLINTMVTCLSSGTERANLIGDENVGPFSPPKPAVFPRTAGYSCSGIVEQVGKNVKDIKVGDRVCAYWSKHAKRLVMNQNNVIKIDSDDISFNEAAFSFITCFPMAAIRKCRTETGESAMVMGQGLLGLFAVKLLKASGAVPIIAVDPNPEKRKVAIKNGADYALDPFEDGFAKKVKEITGGGVKVCIEVTGNGPALDMALDCMAMFGRVALLGCTRHSDFSIDYYRKVHGPGITMIGAHTIARPDNESHPGWWTHRDDMKSFLKLLKYKRIEVKSMIEEIHTPEECGEVFARLAVEKSFPIVQFDWSKMD